MRRSLPVLLVFLGITCFLANSLYWLKKAGNVPVLTPFNVDLYDYFLPYVTFAKQSVVSGSFPLWSPYQGVGRPFFASIQSGLLFPIHWIALVLDAPHAMLAIQALTVAIAMVGTVLYMRYLEMDWPAAALSAMLFGYSALVRSLHVSAGSSYCLLPIIIWLTQRLIDRPSYGTSVCLAGSLALSFLAGNTQNFFYLCVMVFIYFSVMLFISRQYGFRAIAYRTAMGAFVFILMTGMVSIQLLPTLELSLASIRNLTESLPAGDIFIHEFSILDMLRGYFDPEENLYYFGSSLFLIPFALGDKKRRIVVVALLVSLGYSILFVLSKQSPILSIFGEIPFSDRFRRHINMLDLGHFMIAALAGIGISAFWEKGRIRLWDFRTRKFDWFWLLVVLWAIAVLYLSFLFRRAISGRSIVYPLVLSLCVVITAILLSSAPRFSPRAKGFITLAVALAIMLDMLVHKNIKVTVPGTTGITTPDVFSGQVKWLQENDGFNRALLIPHGFGFYNPNVGTMFGFCNINSYETFILARWHNFVRFMVGVKEFDHLTRISTFYGVIANPLTEAFLREARMSGAASLRYFFASTADEIEAVGKYRHAWVLVHESKDHGKRFSVYENKYALPRAYLVNRYIITRNEEESLQEVRRNILNLSSSVVLENAAPSFRAASEPTNLGRIHLSKYGINELELHIETDAPSLAVLTDSYYPGWSAFLDGERKPIWRANSLFRAVEVPPGNHTLTFKFRPASFYWGSVISLSTLLLVLAGLLLGRYRIRRKQNASTHS